MKKKDIVVLIMCSLVIFASLFIIFGGFSKSAPKTQPQTKETMNFSGDIQKEDIDKLLKRKDYGVPPMDGIGRENPFASL